MSNTAARRVTRARTLEGDFASDVARSVAVKRAGHYPLTQYQPDPVRYATERLHVQLMPHQEAIARAVAAGINHEQLPDGKEAPDRVSVRSGQKCGKTLVAIVVAMWFYECFDSARVSLCAAIEAQTKEILWAELGAVLRKARKAGSIIDGTLAASPGGGFVSTDLSRKIRGITGRDIESIAGYSGRQLTVIDEASHLPEAKAQVFAGNSMGGGSVLMISNPTRNAGPFYDSFHRQKEHWQNFHIDSEKVVEWKEKNGRDIEYTVARSRLNEMREIYGEDSPFWIMRVKGDWLRNETGRAISMHAIEAALERWVSADDNDVLNIGYDPAGPGDGGDEHVWAFVRGSKCERLHPRRGLDEDAAVAETLSLLKIHRRPGEIPQLKVDAEGPIGSVIFARLRSEAERRRLHEPAAAFDVFAVRSSSKYVRDKTKFVRVREELIWALSEWMATGAIPRDDKLQSELWEPVWSSIPSGQLVATPKDDIREKLGRSPDRFDALALAVHVPRVWMGEEPPDNGGAAKQPDQLFASPRTSRTRGDEAFSGFGDDAWRDRGGDDPDE